MSKKGTNMPRANAHKKRLRMISGTCAALILIATGASSASARGILDPVVSPVNQLPETSAEADAWAKVLRADLGFPTDSAFMETVSRTVGASIDDFGVPLLPSELRELQRRQELLTNVEPLRKAIPAAAFGGGWVDHLAGGTLVIAVVDNDPAAVATVKSLLPPAVLANVKIVSVDISEKRLSQIVSEVGVDSPKEWGVTSAESHVQLSEVEVEIPTSAPSSVEETLLDKYGSKVKVVRSDSPATPAVSRTSATLPLYGGQRITTRVIGTTDKYFGCTVGYSNVRDTNGQFLTLTAGHCGSQGSDFAQGQIDGVSRYIGKGQKDQVVDGATITCDCLVIGQIPGGSGTSQWQLNNNTIESFSGQSDAVEETTVVCHSGATTMQQETDGARGNYRGAGVVQCGLVLSRDSYKNLSLVNERGVRENYALRYGQTVKMTCLSGDSGGTVGNNRRLYGIVSWANSSPGTADARCGYSLISYTGQLGLTIGF